MSRGHVPSLEPIEHDYGLMDQHWTMSCNEQNLVGDLKCHSSGKVLAQPSHEMHAIV